MLRSMSLARSLAHPPIFPINYSDVATVELAEGNMASFVSDMERDLAFERLQIDKVLDAARRRGGDFFERRSDGSFVLRAGVAFYLYCSSAPCGNSTIRKWAKTKREVFRDELGDGPPPSTTTRMTKRARWTER